MTEGSPSHGLGRIFRVFTVSLFIKAYNFFFFPAISATPTVTVFITSLSLWIRSVKNKHRIPFFHTCITNDSRKQYKNSFQIMFIIFGIIVQQLTEKLKAVLNRTTILQPVQ